MKAIKTILYPTDFSELSQYGLRLACTLARAEGARLIVLHIVPRPVAVTWGGDLWELHREECYGHDLTKYREEMQDKLAELDLSALTRPAQRLLKEGDVARVILDTARDTACDLIVMGTHGMTGERWRLMGNIAEEVARSAPCPVLYVKVPVPQSHSEVPCKEKEVDVIL